MIRCGWFLTDLAAGGAERVPLVLADALERTELSVVLLKDRVDHQVPADGPRIIKLSSGKRSLRAAGGTIFFGAVRAARTFDVLVAGLEWAPTLFTVATGTALRRPVVATVHTDLHRYQEFEPVPTTHWVGMRVALSRCAAVVAVSEDVRASVVELGVPEQRIHVIPNPARPQAPVARAPRSGPLRILTVASLKKIKGVDLALEAAAKVNDIDYEWVIVGDGPEREALHQQAQNLGLGSRVKFVGFQPDPLPFYRRSDAYVLPSRSEGVPLVLAEALSAGLPIVATRCGAGVESMIGPQVGELVANSDADALSVALRAMLIDSERRERLREGALSRAEEYEPSRIAGHYDRLLARVATDADSGR